LPFIQKEGSSCFSLRGAPTAPTSFGPFLSFYLTKIKLCFLIGINIAFWGYKEQMSGIHFATAIIQGLAVLNLSVDVDLYAGGPDLGSC
jgi:hypothetical protein